MTTKKRKTFDPSLKLEVVRMIKEQGLSIQNVSESMDIGQTAVIPPFLERAKNRG
jgi:transposase